MWRRYFKFTAVPGVIINPKYGRIDFRRDDLSIDMLQDLYENDFPYLRITEAGKAELYGIKQEIAEVPVHPLQLVPEAVPVSEHELVEACDPGFRPEPVTVTKRKKKPV